MTDRKKVIAVLDDEAKMRLALARLLKTHGYDVAPFESGDDFLKAVHSDRPDCMLLDLHMPRPTGFDVLASISSMHNPMPVIEIGRASCRERVSSSVGAVSIENEHRGLTER